MPSGQEGHFPHVSSNFHHFFLFSSNVPHFVLILALQVGKSLILVIKTEKVVFRNQISTTDLGSELQKKVVDQGINLI